MEPRLNFNNAGKDAMKAMYGISKHLATSSLDQQLLELVYFRVSQMNGCAFCLDMHSKDLRAKGESEQRLYLLSSWREAPFYTDRERAALAWAEGLTDIKSGLLPDDIYEAAKQQFSEPELVDLTLAVTTINAYNRFNIAFGAPVGTYEVGQFA